MKSAHVRWLVLFLLTFCFTQSSISADVKAGADEIAAKMQSQKANTVMLKGIYVTQENAENTPFFNSLIQHAKAAGINTFIVDLELVSSRYAQNVSQLQKNNIRYVARIIMFPGGGTPDQITTESHWKRKYNLIEHAIAYGAKEIQLDYIRYNTRNGASSEHAKNIYKIIHWYKNQLAQQNIPLQVDVFGISSFGEEKNIGQSVTLFSQTIDTLCPMVYPSHFVPFAKHVQTPYETVYDSLVAIKDQFANKVPVKLVPYIELSNYHYPLSHAKKLAYIYAQIRAAQDAGADGWYAWSARNQYDNLFKVLETYPAK